MSEMILRLHHVQITIPSAGEAVARAFYIDLLGLLEIPKPDSLKKRGGFWLFLAGQEIHVSCEDGVNRLATKAHIAYQVSDLGFWRSRLKVRHASRRTCMSSSARHGLNR